MKNKTAFLPIRVSVFNCGFPNEQIRFGKAIYLLPVPIGSLLFVLLARRFCTRGDGMPPCCLATGRWGAARRRLDTQEIARDPAPCPLPGLMKNRQVDMTKINSLLQKRHYVLDTNDWPLLYYDSLKRVHSCNSHFHFWTKKQCKKWFGPRVGLVLSRFNKLSYAKKSFFVP